MQLNELLIYKDSIRGRVHHSSSMSPHNSSAGYVYCDFCFEDVQEFYRENDVTLTIYEAINFDKNLCAFVIFITSYIIYFFIFEAQRSVFVNYKGYIETSVVNQSDVKQTKSNSNKPLSFFQQYW